MGSVAHAEIPNDLEPDYSEAVLAFNSKDYNRALFMLDQLLTKFPKQAEFLELKALTLKSSKKESEAAAVYGNLIQSKTKEGKPKSEIAPYAYELGMIRFKEKKMEQAAQYFTYSAANGFNEGTSRFYLGLIAYENGQWESAQASFSGVLSSQAEDLKPAAHFYLAQTFIKTQYPQGAIQNYFSAKKLSAAVLKDEKLSEENKVLARQIDENSTKALAPFDKAQFFGNVSAITTYDSNVLAIPTAVTGAIETSGKSTIRENISGGVGYASSPLNSVQFVPSYRFSLNRNFNADSRSSEFAENSLSLYATKDALARTSYGAKVEANLIFQTDVDPVTDEGTYRRYSHSIAAGPYFKHEIKKQWVLGGEVFFKPQTFARDPSSEELKRSGNSYLSRFFVQNNAGRRWWNPMLALRYERVDTKGTEYNAGIVGAQVYNQMNFSDKTRAVALIDYSQYSYSERRTGSRTDKLLFIQASGVRRLTSHWSLLAIVDYTKNASNVEDQFSYNRVTLSAGVTYSF